MPCYATTMTHHELLVLCVSPGHQLCTVGELRAFVAGCVHHLRQESYMRHVQADTCHAGTWQAHRARRWEGVRTRERGRPRVPCR